MKKTTQTRISVRTPKDLGRSIRLFRKSCGLSQIELGLESRLKQSNISTLEAGAPGTRISTLFRILSALNLEITISERTKSSWSPEEDI